MDAANITVETALMSGVTPRRTRPNTNTGKVVEPGPDTKLVITTSSSDSVSASSAPPSTPGMISGSVTRRNAFHREA